jgi:hypothetical protein
MNRLALVLGGILLAVILVLSFMLTRAHAATRKAGLTADSLEVVLDTTRHRVLSTKDSIRLLGDSLAIAQRRAFQVVLERDALDRALNVTRLANASLSARVRTLEATNVSSSSPTTENAEGERKATFDHRDPPFTVHAVVTLPAPPARGRLDSLTVALDPIPLAIRPSCGAKNAQGIRSAQWTVTSPPWATIALDSVAQNPELCNPTGTSARRGFWPNVGGWIRDHVGTGPSYSVVFIDGEARHAPGWSAIIRLWPTH